MTQAMGAASSASCRPRPPTTTATAEGAGAGTGSYAATAAMTYSRLVLPTATATSETLQQQKLQRQYRAAFTAPEPLYHQSHAHMGGGGGGGRCSLAPPRMKNPPPPPPQSPPQSQGHSTAAAAGVGDQTHHSLPLSEESGALVATALQGIHSSLQQHLLLFDREAVQQRASVEALESVAQRLQQGLAGIESTLQRLCGVLETASRCTMAMTAAPPPSNEEQQPPPLNRPYQITQGGSRSAAARPEEDEKQKADKEQLIALELRQRLETLCGQQQQDRKRARSPEENDKKDGVLPFRSPLPQRPPPPQQQQNEEKKAEKKMDAAGSSFFMSFTPSSSGDGYSFDAAHQHGRSSLSPTLSFSSAAAAATAPAAAEAAADVPHRRTSSNGKKPPTGASRLKPSRRLPTTKQEDVDGHVRRHNTSTALKEKAKAKATGMMKFKKKEEDEKDPVIVKSLTPAVIPSRGPMNTNTNNKDVTTNGMREKKKEEEEEEALTLGTMLELPSPDPEIPPSNSASWYDLSSPGDIILL